MKTINVKNFFKAISKKQVTVNPALSDRLGKKREDCNWKFNGFEKLEEIPVDAQEAAIYFLNGALEKYGKDLISDNSDNWSFIPAIEEITLGNAFAYYNSDSRKSWTLTKVTAAFFAEFYSTHAPALLGIPATSAQAAKQVFVGWNTYSKKEDIRAAMFTRLEQFAEALAEEKNVEIATEFAEFEIPESEISLLEVLSALIKAFSPALASEVISADAL